MNNLEIIKERINENSKSLDQFIKFFEKELFAKDMATGQYVTDPYLTFLLALDSFSNKLYNKNSTEGCSAIDLSKYTDGETGYFDKLFEVASLLVRDLIVEEIQKEKSIMADKWNVILKMDTHNNPQGKSKYSLITPNREFFITDRNCNSLAYTLFFDYSLFCKSMIDCGKLTEEDIYTVHKEFINEKIARSFAYELKSENDKSILVKYIDGDKEIVTNKILNIGEKHYRDFIHCILDSSFIKQGASSFSNYLVDPQTDNSWKKGVSLKSFSYYNLGIPGFESWGTLMIECDNEVQTVYDKFYRRGGDNDDTLLLARIKNVISALKKIDDEYNDALNKQRIKEESVKSAKAAIMSRNMSHNLGSHVMSYLKQHLGTVKEMLNDKILSILFKDENDLIKKHGLTGKDPIEENVALPFLLGLGKFISYLQERQDFIATIATDFIPYYSNVNFKDTIYDELNPDKRNERHSERTTSQRTDNILLGNIARSEGLGRPTSPTRKTELYIDINTQANSMVSEEMCSEQKNMDSDISSELKDIVIKFRNFDGNAVERKEQTAIIITNQAGYDSLKEMRKYDVSLPGGVVGRQAIFSIVENVIRNAAKHGHREQNQDLELSFDIFTKEDVLANEADKGRHMPSNSDNNNDNHLSLRDVLKTYYLGVTINNDGQEVTTVSDADDLYFVTLTDNLPFTEESLGELRKALIEDYVNEKGVMNEGNKGIKEIRISSAWLRSIKDEKGLNTLIPYDEILEQIEKNNNAAIINDAKWKDLKSVKNDEKIYAPNVYVRISEGHLQYIFCLVRPKKVAVISSIFKDVDEYHKSSVIANSWGVFTPEVFIDDTTNKSYEFILVENDDDYDSVRVVASSRTIKMSDLIGYIDKDSFFRQIKDGTFDAKEIEKKLYKKLSGIKAEELDNIYLFIDDETALRKNRDNDIAPTVIKGITRITKGARKGEMAPYIYRAHFETKDNFTDVVSQLGEGDVYHGNKYIEGITGNNSTDRLVRNEIIDEKWGYKHLHAMKENIAIFDERLFAKIFGVKDDDFYKEEMLLEKKKNNIISILKSKVEVTENEIGKKLLDLDINKVSNCESLEKLGAIMDFLKNKYDQFSENSEVVNGDRDSVDLLSYAISNSYSGTAFAQKGVMVFNLFRDLTNKDKFNLCGLHLDEEHDIESSLDESRLHSKCSIIAQLSWDGEKLNVDWKNNAKKIYEKKFDHMSIHQGLLDKMYESFGLKHKGTEDLKEKFTKNFYEFFSKNSDSIGIGKDEEGKDVKFFLPGLCIHSGRSKPSETDMPQHLPFIQYASIENAVLDCKYSLVELLDFARYEHQ
jgi:hypothetical protein